MVYRPLYKDAHVYKLGKLSDIRPLEMFMSPVEKNGQAIPRFTLITNPAAILELRAVADEMYPEAWLPIHEQGPAT